MLIQHIFVLQFVIILMILTHQGNIRAALPESLHAGVCTGKHKQHIQIVSITADIFLLLLPTVDTKLTNLPLANLAPINHLDLSSVVLASDACFYSDYENKRFAYYPVSIRACRAQGKKNTCLICKR